MNQQQRDELRRRIRDGVNHALAYQDCIALHVTMASAMAAVNNFIGAGMVPDDVAEDVLRTLAVDLRIDFTDLVEVHA